VLTAEQMLAAQKANVETLFGLTNKAFEGVEKLVELNLQVAKAAMTEAADAAKAALSVKDAQELMALQASLLQPAAEKASAYSRHVYDIATATNADVSRVAESTVADVQKKFVALVDSATKAVAAANNAFDGVQKATKQATEVAEANFHAMTATAVKASQSAGKGRRAA
jgi:phasin family protein